MGSRLTAAPSLAHVFPLLGINLDPAKDGRERLRLLRGGEWAEGKSRSVVMNTNRAKINSGSVMLFASLVAGACALAPLDEGAELASETAQELSRSWTCSATLTYGNHSYTPEPWTMTSGSLFPDREHRCKGYIVSHWLSDPELLNLLGVTEGEKSAICANGNMVSVRVDYGFDARPKSWQFTSSVSAQCPSRNYACGFAMSNVSGNRCENGRTTRYVTAPNLTAAISACQAVKPAAYPLFCLVLDQDGTAPSDASECEAAPPQAANGQPPEWRPSRSCCRFEGETTCPR
jgi:hypothetical protein